MHSIPRSCQGLLPNAARPASAGAIPAVRRSMSMARHMWSNVFMDTNRYRNARRPLLLLVWGVVPLSCAGAFAEEPVPAARAALRSCLSSEIGGQDGRSDASAAVQCGVGAVSRCFDATDFAGCLNELTAELRIFSAQLIASGKGTVSLSPTIADMARKRSVCSEIVSAETHAQCDVTAEIEFLEALLLINGES